MVVTAHDLAWIARTRQFTANYRLLHADFHIAAGRIFEDRRLRARLPRRYLRRGAALDPALPIRPPGSRLFLRLGKPVGKFPDRRPIGPMLVLAGGRRVDHPGDVAGARHHELDVAAEELRS